MFSRSGNPLFFRYGFLDGRAIVQPIQPTIDMAKMKTLEDLFEHELKDLYSAEKQFIEAMPKMMQAATDSRLKRVFEKHLEETKAQKQRLEQVKCAVSARAAKSARRWQV